MENEFSIKSLPEVFVKATFGYRWQQNFIGCSTSQVFRLEKVNSECLYLKTSPLINSELEKEKQRLEWLAGKLAVPKVYLYQEDGRRDYLLISEIEGAAASEDVCKNNVPKVIGELAAGLKLIHSLPVSDCPFDETLDQKIQQARHNLERGLVDESDFDNERLGRTAADLFQELLATKPTSENLIFTHGDYCLPNITLKDSKLNGFVDWGRAGIADSYQDIALLARSVASNFGGEWLPFLFERCGIEPEYDKLRFYTLLDEFF